MLHAGIVWLRNGWNTWFSLKPLPHLLPAKVSSLRFDARMCKQRPREETTKRRDVTTEESQSLAINLHGTNVFFLWKCNFQKFGEFVKLMKSNFVNNVAFSKKRYRLWKSILCFHLWCLLKPMLWLLEHEG
jgi:hypothetical protein